MSSHYHPDAYTTETNQDGYPIKPPPPRYARVSNHHQQEIITIPEQEPIQPQSVADSSNPSDGVMIVSTMNTRIISASFILPLVIHIILTIISGYYLVFLVPFLIALIALIGMSVWILSINVTELGMEQLIQYIIGRFAFGWWVIGMIFLVILSLEGPIVYYIPIDNQVGAWFFLLFMAYILFAAQYVILIYVFCVERNVAGGTVWNNRDNTMKIISVQSLAIGATICTLWVTFLTFTYRLDFVGDILNIDIPAAFNALLIATAVLLTASIVPMDALIGQYLAIRARTRIMSQVAAGNEGPIPSVSVAIAISIFLRGTLIMLMFFCLVGVLSTSGGWSAAVIVYIVLVKLMLFFFAVFIRGQKKRLEQIIEMQRPNHHHQQQQVQLRVVDEREAVTTNKYDEPDG